MRFLSILGHLLRSDAIGYIFLLPQSQFPFPVQYHLLFFRYKFIVSGYYFSIAAVVSWIVLVGTCLSVLIQDRKCGRLYVREMLKLHILRRTGC